MHASPQHAIKARRLRRALRAIGGDFGTHVPVFLLAWFTNVDAAIEERSIPNSDALCSHVAGYRTFTPEVHTVAGMDVAAHLAKNNHFTGGDIRRHLCITANRDPAPR
jgi:hypothetical protein